MAHTGTPGTFATPRSDGSGRNTGELANKPSMLCRWTIHAAIRTRYEGDDEEDFEQTPDAITRGEEDDHLPRWPSTHKQTFEEKLQAALENNRFSNLDINNLPMAIAKIVKATRSSPRELLQESFAFSLVARNEELFWNLLGKMGSLSFEDTGIYPLHLLTSFLDGSKTCCNLLDAALNQLAEYSRIDKIYVNNHGHTVLDNLFISILKGHTSCLPRVVNDKVSKTKRFTGEEVDICGRWDADSHCVRELFAEGHSTIPIEWKHMFCHTSVQTICHCIGRLFGPMFAPDINTPSGLFMKKCEACGMKLQVGPLHSLVLTACHLAQSGCPGENLFGMLACLVCLLVNGADPLQTAPISLAALMRTDSAIDCSHEDIDPVQLAERVPSSLIAGWTDDATLGWKVFCTMLRWARDERRPSSKTSPSKFSKGKAREDPYQLFMEPMDEETDEQTDDDEESEDTDSNDDDVDEELCPHIKPDTDNFYGRSKAIGTMWAAIQTELLTYRRLTDGEPWISENFDLQSVLEGLNNGGLLPIKLVEEDMMAPFCQCGRFLDITDEACACVDEVYKGDYFANVDVWSRSTYIMIPEGRNNSWYWL
jgi:hypothetical protein